MNVCNFLINERLVNWCEGIDFTGPRVGIALSIVVIIIAAKVNEYAQPKIEQMQQSPEEFDFEEAEVDHRARPPQINFAELVTDYQEFIGKQNFRDIWGGIFNHIREEGKIQIATALLSEVSNIRDLLTAFKDSKRSKAHFSKAPQSLKIYDFLTRASFDALVNLPRAAPDPEDKGKDEGKGAGNFSEILSRYTQLSQKNRQVFRTSWDEIFNGLLEEDQARIAEQQIATAAMIEKCLKVFDHEDAIDIAVQFIRDPAQGIVSDSEVISMGLHDLLVGGALNTCLEAQLAESVIDE